MMSGAMIRFELVETRLDEGQLEALAELSFLVFSGGYTASQLSERLETGVRRLSVLAWDEARLVGFKLGYEERPGRFYSWLGGVHPEHRGQGLGRGLMQRQHERLSALGFEKVRTVTMNRWRSMLIMNLRFGFDIVGTYQDDAGRVRIILERRLGARTGAA